MKESILDRLAVGDMRTTGTVPEVVAEVLHDPSKFAELFNGLKDERPGVKMRSADALEKITQQRPELMVPLIDELITIAQQTTQQEVQWHIAQIIDSVPLKPTQAAAVVPVLLDYYHSSTSNIVKVFSLTTLAHLAHNYSHLEATVKPLLENALTQGSPAVKSRAKKLARSFDV